MKVGDTVIVRPEAHEIVKVGERTDGPPLYKLEDGSWYFESELKMVEEA